MGSSNEPHEVEAVEVAETMCLAVAIVLIAPIVVAMAVVALVDSS